MGIAPNSFRIIAIENKNDETKDYDKFVISIIEKNNIETITSFPSILLNVALPIQSN